MLSKDNIELLIHHLDQFNGGNSIGVFSPLGIIVWPAIKLKPFYSPCMYKEPISVCCFYPNREQFDIQYYLQKKNYKGAESTIFMCTEFQHTLKILIQQI